MKHDPEKLMLQLGSSRLLGIHVALTHALACAVICWSAFYEPFLLSLLLPLVVSARRSWVLQVSRTAPAAIRSLESLADGEWRLIDRKGRVVTARLAPQNFVAPWMTILTFRLGRFRRRHIVLLRDNCDLDGVRRLRVRLRTSAP
jgi:hypothetical protein